MRNIATFHRLATAAVEKTASGNAEGQKITFNVIKQRMSDVLYKLTSQKFEDPGGWAGGAWGMACPAAAAGAAAGIAWRDSLRAACRLELQLLQSRRW